MVGGTEEQLYESLSCAQRGGLAAGGEGEVAHQVGLVLLLEVALAGAHAGHLGGGVGAGGHHGVVHQGRIAAGYHLGAVGGLGARHMG